jgi:hypothetical protein
MPLRGSFLIEFSEASGIYPSDGGAITLDHAPAHRLDEFPVGYSLAVALQHRRFRFANRFRVSCKVVLPVECFSANGQQCLNCLCQPTAQAQYRFSTMLL